MSLVLYTVTVIDHVNNPNNTLANTDIVIRTTQAGAPLAIIYADEDGLIPIAQPGAKTNDLGVFEFYASSANYNFTATVNGETRKIGGVNASSVMTESGGSVQDFIDNIDQVHRRITTAANVGAGNHKAGDKLTLSDRDNYDFDVVVGGTPDGQRVIDAGNGNTAVLQLKDNMYTDRSAGYGSATVRQFFNEFNGLVFKISDGTNQAQSHVANIPWEIRRDSHSFIVEPHTVGGQCDYLWRRSPQNPDPFGNRFAFNMAESPDSGVTPDTYSFVYATSDIGKPNFDAAYSVKSGSNASMEFPSLSPTFRGGWSAKRRSTGVFDLQLALDVNEHTWKDKTTGNILGTVNDTGFTLGGVKHTNLVTPPPKTGSNSFADTWADGLNTLPATKTIFSTGSANRSAIIDMYVAFATSGGGKGVKKTTYHYDGATITAIDVINTLPVQVTANIVVNGSTLELTLDYAGGLGSGYNMAVSLHYTTAGR